ncbi:hypothetical protein EMIT0P218_70126 [Pseudomonas sp. IT-P218]
MLKALFNGTTGETCGVSRTGRRNRGRRDLIIKCRVLPIGLRFLGDSEGLWGDRDSAFEACFLTAAKHLYTGAVEVCKQAGR